MPIKKVEKRQDQWVPVKIWTDNIDAASLQQLCNIAALPFVHKHVAAMPDVHLGKGATVGSVIATRKAIIPAAVGVDIGCGMNAVQTSLTASDLPDSLAQLRSDIESRVPLGVGGSKKNLYGSKESRKMFPGLRSIYEKTDFDIKGWDRQIGTLGSGNHFIEICLDKQDQVWIMLHSGSRGIGNRIGQRFIQEARDNMERRFIQLPDKDLAYLVEGEDDFNNYIEAVEWAQNYALVNRQVMMRECIEALEAAVKPFELTGEGANCHHNYVEKENHFGKNVYLTRKGAIRAREGDIGIIPGSMGTRSYIVRGLGNENSFNSCSHGAGRNFSRGEAKKRFTVEDLKEQTKGIECRKDEGVIDEIPSAYKDIDEVMENQNDLVEILFELRQIVNIKG